MQSTTKVALDAMGGDNAPAEVVKGAVDAVNKRNDIKIFLIGQKVPVERELSLYTYPKEQIEIVDAPEVIEMAEPPVVAIRRKKQSSIVVGMNMVKNKEADAFVSAGSSGAVLVGGQVIVGRIKGIQRPPLAPLIPTERGVSLLIDCGANVDARAEVCSYLGYLGVTINAEANKKRGEEVEISTPDSTTKVYVVPTDEELAIARETARLVK